MAEALHLPVEAAYDRWSATYDVQDNPMVAAAARILPEVCGNVVGQRIVEFGCGTGRNLAALKQAGARDLAGIDLSAGMLAKARVRDPAFNLCQGEMATTTPFATGAFDLALFCLSLEHAERLEPPLAEAARLVAAGGRVIVIEIHPWFAFSGGAAHFSDAEGDVRMPTFPHRFSDYISAGVKAGLVLTESREWTPASLGEGLSAKVWKRGADHPLAMSMVFRRQPVSFPLTADAG